MGFTADQTNSHFTIKKENQEAAFKAAKAMPEKDYHWVKKGWQKGLRDVYAILEHWGWDPSIDDDSGDIVDISFGCEKIGEELALFKAIAPFVEKDSFIEMQGEGYTWRYIFDGTTCVIKDL